MHSPDRSTFRFLTTGLVVLSLFAVGAAAFLTPAGAEDKVPEAKASEAKAPAGPKMFESPKAAAVALVEAAEKNDSAAIRTLFGAEGSKAMRQGKDPVVKKERADFAAAAKKQARLEDNEDGSKTLVVGENEWPLPFPLKQKDGKWFWDAVSGLEEVKLRRIGRNELRAIDVMKTYVEAQIEYAGQDRDGDGVREYAQIVRSSEGKRDGLYWDTAEDEAESPLGPFVDSWRLDTSAKRTAAPKSFGGYYFRILRGQGGAAPGGRHPYVLNGNMIAGFAMVAYPAEYGTSGIMSFMVSHHGKILERDLGRCTAASVRKMIGFNPVKGWTAVKGD